MKIFTVEEKIQNACFKLNHDAYALQTKGKKRLRHFKPCDKALVLLACLREGSHFGTALMNASLVICDCHSGLSMDDIWSMCIDETEKLKHCGIRRETADGKQATDEAI